MLSGVRSYLARSDQHRRWLTAARVRLRPNADVGTASRKSSTLKRRHGRMNAWRTDERHCHMEQEAVRRACVGYGDSLYHVVVTCRDNIDWAVNPMYRKVKTARQTACGWPTERDPTTGEGAYWDRRRSSSCHQFFQCDPASWQKLGVWSRGSRSVDE